MKKLGIIVIALFSLVFLQSCGNEAEVFQAPKWVDGYWVVDSVEELSTVYNGPSEAYVLGEGSFYSRNALDSTWSAQTVVGVDTVSPSGAVTPIVIGQLYIDTVGVDTVYIATGETDTSWVQLN